MFGNKIKGLLSKINYLKFKCTELKKENTRLQIENNEYKEDFKHVESFQELKKAYSDMTRSHEHLEKVNQKLRNNFMESQEECLKYKKMYSETHQAFNMYRDIHGGNMDFGKKKEK